MRQQESHRDGFSSAACGSRAPCVSMPAAPSSISHRSSAVSSTDAAPSGLNGTKPILSSSHVGRTSFSESRHQPRERLPSSATSRPLNYRTSRRETSPRPDTTDVSFPCKASPPGDMLRPMLFTQIFLRLTCLLAGIAVAGAQSQPPAPDQFQNCAPCHGGDAQGGEHGPPIAARLLTLDDDELMQIIRGGKPQIGMPAFPLNDADMRGLIKHLRTLERPESQPRIRASVQTIRGESFQGLVLSQSVGEMQLRTDDRRLHLLRRDGRALPRGHFRCRLERL